MRKGLTWAAGEGKTKIECFGFRGIFLLLCPSLHTEAPVMMELEMAFRVLPQSLWLGTMVAVGVGVGAPPGGVITRTSIASTEAGIVPTVTGWWGNKNKLRQGTLRQGTEIYYESGISQWLIRTSGTSTKIK